MKNPITKILEILGDGKPHDLEEISEKLHIPIEFVKEFASFLIKWNLAEPYGRRKIRLKSEFLQLPRIENPLSS